MKNVAYYNGEIGLIEEMTVPMNDRVCWFGDGVYDAGPASNGKIFAIDEHVDRFYRSAAAVDIEIPMSKEELKALLSELVSKLDTPDAFVYYQVTRGTGMRIHQWLDGPGNLWVMIKPQAIDEGTEPVKLITYPDKRFFYCNVKTLNLLPSVLSANAAEREGCAEAIFYRDENEVTECSHSNISVLKDGVLYTHPNDEKILPGIAKKHLLGACEALGIPYKEEVFGLEFLRNADELIKTSSSKMIKRVCELDHQPAGMKDEAAYEKLRKFVLDEYRAATSV